MEKKYKILILVSVCIVIVGVALFITSAFRSYSKGKEIREAFDTANRQLEEKNKAFNADVELSDSAIQFYNKTNPAIVEDFSRIKSTHDSLKNEITLLKDTLIRICEANKNAYDQGPAFMLEKGNAAKLKERINYFIGLQNALRKKAGLTEKTENYFADAEGDGKKVSWENFMFSDMPLAGLVTNLTVIQSDLKHLLIELTKELDSKNKK